MGECLWLDFLDEYVADINEVLVTIGVYGLLQEYTAWLQDNAQFCNGKLQRREENNGTDRI